MYRNISMNFRTFIPEREDWKNGSAHLARDFVQIYTDGSQEEAVGCGIYSESVRTPAASLRQKCQVSGLLNEF